MTIQQRRGRARRLLFGGLFPILLVLLLAGLWLRARLRGSLALLDGDLQGKGLRDRVSVARDTLGVPSITAASRDDAAFALGFLHAQDRFFQMDLLRRRAAGELAELLGRAALPVDREVRRHRFRSVARQVLERMPPEEHTLAEAYARGINAGLGALSAPPFEYLLLRARPHPWLPEDSVLPLLAMFLELQDDQPVTESALGLVHDVLPESLGAFLAPQGTDWDAPLAGDPFAGASVPGPHTFDARQAMQAGARTLDSRQAWHAGVHGDESDACGRPGRPGVGILPERLPGAVQRLAEMEPKLLAAPLVLDIWRAPQGPALDPGSWSDDPRHAGSNNWAVAGSRTADGHALLAGDMHLGLEVPNFWYRASIVFPDSLAAGGTRRVTGVTLPGTPAIVAGSNGDVAWAFTNSGTDASDLVILETVPGDTSRYLTPDGPRPFERIREPIAVKGAKAETLEVVETIWGPVHDRDHAGRRRAWRWVAHDPEAVDFGLLHMERARNLDEAVQVANACGIPVQNCVIADRSGRIGWTLMGRLPRRIGFDGRRPTSWGDGARRWDGLLRPSEIPKLLDPTSGRAWTANNRVVSGRALALVGDGGYAMGARARQIRDDLLALGAATPEDMLHVQLDDRALFLQRWRDLLLGALTPDAVAARAHRAAMRRLVEGWGGRAGIESAGYRIVRTFRGVLSDVVLEAPTAACRKADPGFRSWMLPQREGAVWRLLRERPIHFLDPRYQTWEGAILAAADSAVASILRAGPGLAARTWGERNTTRIQHPLSRPVPLLGRWLDMRSRPLPGDGNMPRVQGPRAGASQRMVVSPGHEERGFFHMPCGQSGHPLSPHYRDGHAAWEEGRPTPFLPGPTRHTLVLRPGP